MTSNKNMETNKYYTPTIEEFHVGFEYEQEDRGIGSTLFEKRIIISPSQIESAFEEHEDLDDAEIRVKYLDIEDIKNLGWEVQLAPQESFADNEYWCTKENCGSMTFFDGDVVRDFNLEINNTYYRVKNKSELERLLKQKMIDVKEL